jgi:L-asparaginase / beta-aspartyl-peptidase
MDNVILAVHGGAGNGLSRDTPPEVEQAFRDGLTAALRAGAAVLHEGCVSAVEVAVRVLEDDELFNAGKGSVFTSDGGHELDASIMRGTDLAAGAVAGLRYVRNPISAARLVMETPWVLLAGSGAEEFAADKGLETVSQDYFWTQRRWAQLKQAQSSAEHHAEYSTVGAVAVDKQGDVAAATSTGGMTNKTLGRVGDSPIIGAGTYASNATAAVSATGLGEVFIRGAAASTISNLIEFGGRDLVTAANEVVMERLPALGGTGGVIALDRQGRFAGPHSTPGMFCGWLTAGGEIVTKVFNGE